MAACVGLAVCPAAAEAAPQDVPTPAVTGPIETTGTSHPFFATDRPLARRGYVEEEYFIEGRARNFSTPPLATGSEIAGGAEYRTRIVVRRPRNARRFSGTVVLEWVNVTAQFDIEIDWFVSNEHFMRRGDAWVGVSVQRVGVNALRQWQQDPERYASLDVTAGETVTPSDALSYDIYSQAAKALRSPGAVDPIGGLRVERIIATGHSQSASRLATYHNSVHPLHGVVDGFLIHGSQAALRTDLSVKVIRLLAEGDVTAPSTEQDTDRFRRWEVAGSSHVGFKERSQYEPLIVRDRGSLSSTACDRPPFSRIPFHHVQNAAYVHLERWIEGGPPPPVAPRIAWLSSDPPRKARDARGNALGGIRLPGHVVPTGVNTGDNSGPAFCRLYGSHVPFDEATLARLYPRHADYVARVNRAARAAVREGFLLEPDARATRRAAARSDIGRSPDDDYS